MQAARSAQAFINETHESGSLKTSSVRRLTATLKSFLKWSAQNGQISSCDLPAVTCPVRPEASEPPKIPAEQFDRAMNWLGAQPSVRDAAIVHLLHEGLTPAEAVALDVSSFDATGRRVLVTGRKQRGRYVKLSPEAAAAVAETADLRPSAAPLITNMRGGRLTTRSVSRIAKQFAARTNLPSTTRALTIRQAGAQRYRQDPHVLKHRLGFAGAEATTRYFRD